MPATATPYPSANVLFVDASRVEWLGREAGGGTRAHGCVDVEEATPRALARAAHSARQAAAGAGKEGARPVSCILALGASLARQQRLTLPELSVRDAQGVLHRKAAHLLEGTLDDTLFAARSLSGPAEGESTAGGEGRPWQVVALARSFVTQLLRELRLSGFRIHRTVVARQARLSHAHGCLESTATSAALIVDIEHDAVVLSLVASSTLVAESVLVGDYRTAPGTALTLIPEARRLASYWRRQSRGAAFDQVVVMGLEAELCRPLAEALTTSLSDVRVLRVPAEENGVSGAVHALAACAAQGPLDRDLAVKPAQSPSALWRVGVALIALVGTAGVTVRHSIQRELAQWNERMAALEHSRALLAGADRDAGELDRQLERLHSTEQSMQAVQRLGLPFEDLVGEAFRAAGSEAAWLSIAVARGRDGYDVSLSGVTEDEPLRSLSVLTRTVGVLEQSAFFHGVALAPPTLSRASGATGEPLAFSIEAQVEGFSFEQGPASEPLGAPGGAFP